MGINTFRARGRLLTLGVASMAKSDTEVYLVIHILRVTMLSKNVTGIITLRVILICVSFTFSVCISESLVFRS